jgi:hypothetical protein
LRHSAVSIVLAQRVWQGAAGLATAILIAVYLDPVQQGWYYSFLSLAALYTLFDLGLSVVLVQISARWFVGLSWAAHGRVGGGNASRFMELLARSARYYLVLAGVYLVLALAGGLLFFHGRSAGVTLAWEDWAGCWTFLVLACALGITILPFVAVVEGSGRVHEVYVLRLVQGILGSAACWLVLIVGGGLWAVAAAPAVGFAVALAWLLLLRPAFFQALRSRAPSAIAWHREVWPLQWRVGLSWLSGYLLMQIYTPILFHFQGAIVAGQMGLSLSIANMLGLLAQSWIAQKVPAMAQAVHRSEWVEFDRMFSRNLVTSVAAFICGALVLCWLRLLLDTTRYESRLLPFWPFAGLLGVTLVTHVVGALAAQLRSFGREPLVWLSVTATLLTVPASIWGASTYSADGVVLIIFGVQLLLVLPGAIFVWRRCNREWRKVPQTK